MPFHNGSKWHAPRRPRTDPAGRDSHSIAPATIGLFRRSRNEVAGFCDQVIAERGKVHGKTLSAIRRKIDNFHAMNVFGDTDAAAKLGQLKQQIAGLTGQELSEQPDVVAKLNRACLALKNHILNPENVSQLTGRLKRRVVLD